MLVDVFASVADFSNLFGPNWMHLNAFGCVWMRLDASGCILMRSDNFGNFQKHWSEKLSFGNFCEVV